MLIPDPDFLHPGSRIQGAKKALDPGSGSATLQTIIIDSVSVSADEAEGRVRDAKGGNGSCPYAFPVFFAYHDVKTNPTQFLRWFDKILAFLPGISRI